MCVSYTYVNALTYAGPGTPVARSSRNEKFADKTGKRVIRTVLMIRVEKLRHNNPVCTRTNGPLVWRPEKINGFLFSKIETNTNDNTRVHIALVSTALTQSRCDAIRVTFGDF